MSKARTVTPDIGSPELLANTLNTASRQSRYAGGLHRRIDLDLPRLGNESQQAPIHGRALVEGLARCCRDELAADEIEYARRLLRRRR